MAESVLLFPFHNGRAGTFDNLKLKNQITTIIFLKFIFYIAKKIKLKLINYKNEILIGFKYLKF